MAEFTLTRQQRGQSPEDRQAALVRVPLRPGRALAPGHYVPGDGAESHLKHSVVTTAGEIQSSVLDAINGPKLPLGSGTSLLTESRLVGDFSGVPVRAVYPQTTTEDHRPAIWDVRGMPQSSRAASVVAEREPNRRSGDSTAEDAGQRASMKSSVSRSIAAITSAILARVPIDEDVAEDEIEKVADLVAGAPWTSVAPPSEPARPGRTHLRPIPAARARRHTDSYSGLPAVVIDALNAGQGQALGDSVRENLETRFGRDLTHIRVHTGGRETWSAEAMNARAYSVGEHIVFGEGAYTPHTTAGRHLLAHEVAHVVQHDHAVTTRTAIRRSILVGGPPWPEMSSEQRRRFINSHYGAHPDKVRAGRIVDELASAQDPMRFTSLDELKTEVDKRLSTSEVMEESQTARRVSGALEKAFGYPFTSPSDLYGPRVNYSASQYWSPTVADNYAIRKDVAKNKQLRNLPRSDRCTVYSDPCGLYEWKLTAAGKTDPYTAILALFTPQEPHKRSLLHCDYLVSLVQFRSLAAAIGRTEFNARLLHYGLDRIVLKWNAFDELQDIGSIQRMSPSSVHDLVIGDHVVFYNNVAYPLLNRGVGNAWQLENAIFVNRIQQQDIFLGHGSGRMTETQMKAKLAEEYNKVADEAIALTHKADSKRGTASTDAMGKLSSRFPCVNKIGNVWRVQGVSPWCSKPVDVSLRRIGPSEVVGLHDPCDPSRMGAVQRPAESR